MSCYDAVYHDVLHYGVLYDFMICSVILWKHHACIYMCTCICVYIYIYICIHVHIHIYTHNYHGMVYVLNVWIVHSCTNHTVPCHRMLYGIAYSISHQIVLNYHVSSHGACIELFIMRVCES